VENQCGTLEAAIGDAVSAGCKHDVVQNVGLLFLRGKARTTRLEGLLQGLLVVTLEIA